MQMTSIYMLLFVGFTALVLKAVCFPDWKPEKTARVQRWILLAASFLFILYADWRFALVIGVLCVVTWWGAQSSAGRKIGICFALLSLIYYKYTNFFLDTVGTFLGFEENVGRLLLPVGISFYTFSAISYLADVQRGKTEVHSLGEVALYLSFFPKITSGPIQRSQDFFSQMRVVRKIDWDHTGRGMQIFFFGLFKKIVLADRLSVFVNQVYEVPVAFSGATVLLAVIAYSFQLYFDFSGYSDMAVGVAEILDIHLPRNFNLPYLSHNITEFWKRWHITLSSWLQDYVYIPLGGSRKGNVRTYLNLILTMALGGIWHGAGWNYILWGLIHGFALVVHKVWSKHRKMKTENLFTELFSILLTFFVVSFCWIFFRAESLPKAFMIIRAIFTWQSGIFHPYVWLFFSVLVYFVSVFLAAGKSRAEKDKRRKQNTSWVQGFYPVLELNSVWGLTAFFVLIGLTLGLAHTGGSPFIYGAY